MVITNGCLGSATDVMNALKEVFKLQAINTNQEAIYYWSSTKSGSAYSRDCNCLIYGANSENCGSVSLAINQCLCSTNFSTNFPVTGCIGSYNTPDLCGLCAIGFADVNVSYYGTWCVCTAGKGTYFSGRNGGGWQGFSMTCCNCYGYPRMYADCYRLCWDALYQRRATDDCYCWCRWTCMQLSFGSNLLKSFGFMSNCTTWLNCCIAPTLYEMKRVPNTYACYCFFINGAFQCCIDGNSSYNWCYKGTHDTCVSLICSCACFSIRCLEICYTCPYVVTNVFTFPEPYNYLVLSAQKGDVPGCVYGGTDVLCFDLLCCDYTFIKNIPLNCVTGVTNGLCEYRIRYYNCCICCNSSSNPISNACPIDRVAWALQGVCLNG